MRSSRPRATELDALLQFAADSSLPPDVMARRWLLLAGARIVVTVPPRMGELSTSA